MQRTIKVVLKSRLTQNTNAFLRVIMQVLAHFDCVRGDNFALDNHPLRLKLIPQ